MLEFLPEDIRQAIAGARLRRARRKLGLQLRVGAQQYRVVRLWDEGFSVDSDAPPQGLRGLGQIYDGSRPVFECLIIAADYDGHELHCSFKRMTPLSDRPALDYVRNPDAPHAYLGRD